MTGAARPSPSDGSSAWGDRWDSSSRWIITVLVVAVAAFAGAWLIGLSSIITVVLVAVVAGTSYAWVRISADRRGGTVSTVGTIGRVAVTCVAVLLVIQVVPMGRDHANPAVVGEPDWATPRTRELAVRACYSCHSNEVEWPWYSNVAPVSWAVSQHVDKGRDKLNFSEFTLDRRDADEAIEVILDGSMPPAYYTRFGLHGEADLSAAEQEELIAGLRATPGFADD